jgi:hypothetical protein
MELSMDTRKALYLLLALLIAWLWLSNTPSLAQSQQPAQLTWRVISGQSLIGGDYQLELLGWQVTNEPASGRDYLLNPISPGLRGSGCCCTYLPCVVKNSP